MLKKKTVEAVLNNKYSKVEFTQTHIITTFKPSLFSFDKVVHNLPLFDFKEICKQVARNKNFYDKVNWNLEHLQMFNEFEIHFNSNK
jgi:hypothetical protein